MDPFDEIEITILVSPHEITSDNISLVAPTFTFKSMEPEEQDVDGDYVFEGIGTNIPDRIFVMNNRDYNLAVANHADKWAVFWLFTAGVACFPYYLLKQRQRSYDRMIKKGKEAAAKEQAEPKKLENHQ